MNLERIILASLQRVHPRMLAIGTLWGEVVMDADDASYSGFKRALQTLEEKEQLVVVIGEDRNRAKITAAGIARLAE